MTSPVFYLPPAASPPITVEAALPSGQIDHVASALARLTQQFKNDPGTIDLLTVFANRYQDLETAFWDLLTKTGLTGTTPAFGVTVDQLGKLVGQMRQGNSDSIYLRYISARIVANNSDGMLETILRIVRAVLGDALGKVIMRTPGVASYIVEVQDRAVDAATAGVLQQMLTEGARVGVRWILVYSAVPLAQTFRLDVGPGLDVGHLARGVDSKSTI